MYKQMTILLLFVAFLLGACNESSLEPENEDIQPENVSFGGNNNDDGQPATDNPDEVPVNPGREQNIFEKANPNQWFRGSDGNVNNEQNETTDQTTPSNDGESLDAVRQQVVDLTNDARNRNGVPPLEIDYEVADVAQKKADDMSQNDYFSHTSPTYGSPFDMLKQFGVSYSKASENIAAGQQSPEQVVEGWLNSEGHRRNMLDREVTHIGVGYTSDGNYWTQLFIKK
ncbi:CAP domain-containing protein [Gracilibacillus salinarum]|uniref:CAP domain-containing protein n=1 Tax=Gracilibacillus salinarum TaxID=2932255 RepID=A0ABY4GSH1_9BACI|nr:CAP domain-containing protein [Gracilibacillus salinarum]UOQ87342.1 CAP domain-containing protein [Gracilibacillus salinarum]